MLRWIYQRADLTVTINPGRGGTRADLPGYAAASSAVKSRNSSTPDDS